MDIQIYAYWCQEDIWKVLFPQTNCVVLPGLLVLLDILKGNATKVLVIFDARCVSMGESFRLV